MLFLFFPLLFFLYPLVLSERSELENFFDMNELPIIQKTYDLIMWYVPIINSFPRSAWECSLGRSASFLWASDVERPDAERP